MTFRKGDKVRYKADGRIGVIKSIDPDPSDEETALFVRWEDTDPVHFGIVFASEVEPLNQTITKEQEKLNADMWDYLAEKDKK